MAVQNTSLAALLLRIENSLPNLSKSERKVAEYIRGNPRGIIDLSVAALADACGVSDPTVVRAYKKLGFSGYEDLKLTLAQATVSPDEIIHEEISAEDSVQAVRDKVFQSAVLALQFTRDMLEPETLAAAAQLLMNARKIVIFGLGGSAPVAMDLHHKLLRLGLNAAVYTDPHLQVIACNYLDERDAVFAVSHSGSSRCVVDSTQTAKHRGAKVISLTSAGQKSPVQAGGHQPEHELQGDKIPGRVHRLPGGGADHRGLHLHLYRHADGRGKVPANRKEYGKPEILRRFLTELAKCLNLEV